MSGLILKLRPNEAFLVNGVVVENGDRRTRLRIKTEGANILRLKDAMQPEEATTPLKQAYYVAQRAVAGDIDLADAADILAAAIEQLKTSTDNAEALTKAAGHLKAEKFYAVMRTLGAMINEQPAGETHP